MSTPTSLYGFGDIFFQKLRKFPKKKYIKAYSEKCLLLELKIIENCQKSQKSGKSPTLIIYNFKNKPEKNLKKFRVIRNIEKNM
jgi:hypothetical protein